MIGQQETVAGSTLRRIVLALAIAAVMALLVITSAAAPAFAAAREGKANVVGQQTSSLNQFVDAGSGGHLTSGHAQDGDIDDTAHGRL